MPYSQRFEDGFVYANRLHAGQERKATGIPYVTHLMSVAALVAEYGGSEDQVIAALLHDAAEDQGGRATLDQVRRRFGDAVADIVESVSDTFETPKPPWRERKEAYLAHIRSAPEEALLVSAADKLHNARCIVAELRASPEAAFSRFKGGKDGTLWYFRSLVDAFHGRDVGPIVGELKRTVGEMLCLADSAPS